LIAMLTGALALSQSTSTSNKKTAEKKTVKTAASSKNTAKKGKGSKKSGKTVAAPSYRQGAPTPDRYREIQQALVDKGYLKSEPSGVWDAQSMDAMRQFQTDRNLAATGKLTSASLIALGLGPKNDPTSPPATPTEADATPRAEQ
jgi:hypothetical protein